MEKIEYLSSTEGEITSGLHFESKGIVEEHISSLNILDTFLHLGMFMSYLLYWLNLSCQGLKVSSSPFHSLKPLSFHYSRQRV
jgi:hypothetical protein